MELKKFIRKPVYVKAVQVTDENLIEITKWCGGTAYQTADGDTTFIKVLMHPSKTIPRTKAFVGDWVLEGHNGYRVYTNVAFQKFFEEVPEETNKWAASHDAALKVIGQFDKEYTEQDFINVLTPEERVQYAKDVKKGGE